jgi:hypothetical protein
VLSAVSLRLRFTDQTFVGILPLKSTSERNNGGPAVRHLRIVSNVVS